MTRSAFTLRQGQRLGQPVWELVSADGQAVEQAERFIHTQEPALPVVDGRRFLGMLSIAALCRARVDRTAEA